MYSFYDFNDTALISCSGRKEQFCQCIDYFNFLQWNIWVRVLVVFWLTSPPLQQIFISVLCRLMKLSPFWSEFPWQWIHFCRCGIISILSCLSIKNQGVLSSYVHKEENDHMLKCYAHLCLLALCSDIIFDVRCIFYSAQCCNQHFF